VTDFFDLELLPEVLLVLLAIHLLPGSEPSIIHSAPAGATLPAGTMLYPDSGGISLLKTK
jgi:hypothetical protein